jgi:glucose-6-phosphate 1-dehydrogenase
MDNHLLVIFGASGDLTARKLIPAIYNLYRRKQLPERFAILGISRTDLTDEEFRKKTEPALTFKADNTPSDARPFLDMIHYISIETSERQGYSKAASRIKELDKKQRS